MSPDALGTIGTRCATLNATHMCSLVVFAAMLRAECGRPVPDADPADGGVDARLLLLLETPSAAIGITWVASRDDPASPTRNLRRFLDDAELARIDTLIRNAVPFLIHAPGTRNRAPCPMEVREGIRWLPPLRNLLPRLTVAVLAGHIAGHALSMLRDARPSLPVLAMPHPSPTFVCTNPAVSARITSVLAEASALLRRGAVA